MPRLVSFPKHEVPREIGAQIRSYIAVQWPHLYGRSGELWPCAADNPLRPMVFVLMENEVLISHAEANRRGVLRLLDQDLIAWGLSAVFTYPAWRGSGLAKRVVRAATDYINRSDADIAMLFCGPRLRNFYSACGWTPIDGARIFYGDPAAPNQDATGQIMMLFPTQKGQALAPRFATEPIYVGRITW